MRYGAIYLLILIFFGEAYGTTTNGCIQCSKIVTQKCSAKLTRVSGKANVPNIHAVGALCVVDVKGLSCFGTYDVTEDPKPEGCLCNAKVANKEVYPCPNPQGTVDNVFGQFVANCSPAKTLSASARCNVPNDPSQNLVLGPVVLGKTCVEAYPSQDVDARITTYCTDQKVCKDNLLVRTTTSTLGVVSSGGGGL